MHYRYFFQLHNAHQLADWCMNYLCVNYNKLCKMSPKSMRLLHPENQEYLNENRWPPIWYLKDYDYYQKCLAERDKENKPSLKRSQNSSSGCLCFSGKSRRSESTESNVAVDVSISTGLYNDVATTSSQDVAL